MADVTTGDLQDILGDEYDDVMAGMEVEEGSGESGAAGEGGEVEDLSPDGGEAEAAAPAAAEEAAGEDAEAPQDTTLAQQAYHNRALRRELEQINASRAAEQAQMRQIIEFLVAQQQQRPTPEAGEQVPEVDEDTKKFVEYQNRQIMDMLAPVLAPLAQQQQQVAQANELSQWQQRQAAQAQATSEDLSRQESEYATTPAGAKYFDDVKSYMEVVTAAHKSVLGQLGVPEDRAALAAQGDLRGLVHYAYAVARETGATPPEIIHAYIRSQVQGLPQQAQPAQSNPAAKKKSTPVAAAQKAARQGATARSGAAAPAPQGGMPTMDYIREVGVDAALTDDFLDQLSDGHGNVADRILEMVYKGA